MNHWLFSLVNIATEVRAIILLNRFVIVFRNAWTDPIKSGDHEGILLVDRLLTLHRIPQQRYNFQHFNRVSHRVPCSIPLSGQQLLWNVFQHDKTAESKITSLDAYQSELKVLPRFYSEEIPEISLHPVVYGETINCITRLVLSKFQGMQL